VCGQKLFSGLPHEVGTVIYHEYRFIFGWRELAGNLYARKKNKSPYFSTYSDYLPILKTAAFIKCRHHNKPDFLNLCHVFYNFMLFPSQGMIIFKTPALKFKFPRTYRSFYAQSLNGVV
jgi:hypothetical protein